MYRIIFLKIVVFFFEKNSSDGRLPEVGNDPILSSMRKLHLLFIALTFSITANAADWPQFRFGANRGAASPEVLPAKLHLQWTREFAKPDPAFPGEVRLRYDATYEPVVMGDTIFVPSMVTDSVTALDTATGKVRWRFFTGGPVRFAPVAMEGSVWFGSDDGHVYCVDAADGKLRWKFYGHPDGRKDRNLLGNRRLIPMWPVRGGVVLHEGVVYFAAGLWPEEGIFIHAVDAKTGRKIWTNRDTDKIAGANLDHGVQHVMGLSPQGYLAVVDGKLIAPCGTQLPAVFDLKTGKLGPYTMGWGGRTGLPKGTWFVAGTGRYLAHSGDLYDMRRPNDEKFAKPRGNDYKSKLYPGGFTRVQIDPTNQKYLGDFRRPVLSGETMFYTDNGIVAEDITKVNLEPRKPKTEPRRKNDQYPDKWRATFPRRWKLATNLRVRIQAGPHLYATAPGTVAAIDTRTQKISWQAKLAGDPVSVIAAHGRLYVTTREGKLYAFGAKEIAKPVAHAKPSLKGGKNPLTIGSQVLQDKVKQIEQSFKESVESIAVISDLANNSTGGYAIVLGIKDGAVAELLARKKFNVIAIDPDKTKVNILRRHLHNRGIYGSRITVLNGDPLKYPLPPFLADLVTTETSERFKNPASVSAITKIFHSLRPYGGTACLPVPNASRSKWKNAAAKLSSAKTGEHNNWLLLFRTGPLHEAADWSHAGGGAGNTGSSDDRFLRGPLGLLWYDGSIRWQRQPGKTEVRVAGGRILVRANRMLAIDVFTGRRLWDLPVPQAAGAGAVGEFVALEDSIYVAAGRTCIVLDAATGKERARFPMPKNMAGSLIRLRLWKNHLVGLLGKRVVCLDRKTGKLEWSFEAGRSQLSLAVGGGRVFVSELINTRRGETIAKTGAKTHALDIANGGKVWSAPGGAKVRYSEPHDLLLTATAIFKGKDGAVHRKGNLTDPSKDEWYYQSGAHIAGDSLLVGGSDNYELYDLTSGAKLGDQMKWFRRGCTPMRTSPYMVTTRYKGNAAYIDLDTKKFQPIWNLRAACSNNIFPANGVLNVPNLSGGCTCNYTPTSMALVPRAVLKVKEKK
jgi:outer membrane protein assembly factor BamB